MMSLDKGCQRRSRCYLKITDYLKIVVIPQSFYELIRNTEQDSLLYYVLCFCQIYRVFVRFVALDKFIRLARFNKLVNS